jgi:hypothetical protein
MVMMKDLHICRFVETVLEALFVLLGPHYSAPLIVCSKDTQGCEGLGA